MLRARCFKASILPRKSESERDKIFVSNELTKITISAYCCLVESPVSKPLKILMRRPVNEVFTLVLLLPLTGASTTS